MHDPECHSGHAVGLSWNNNARDGYSTPGSGSIHTRSERSVFHFALVSSERLATSDMCGTTTSRNVGNSIYDESIKNVGTCIHVERQHQLTARCRGCLAVRGCGGGVTHIESNLGLNMVLSTSLPGHKSSIKPHHQLKP